MAQLLRLAAGKQLLAPGGTPDAPDAVLEQPWPRVHALNTVRLVFKDSQLAPHAAPFFVQGARRALRPLSSPPCHACTLVCMCSYSPDAAVLAERARTFPLLGCGARARPAAQPAVRGAGSQAALARHVTASHLPAPQGWRRAFWRRPHLSGRSATAPRCATLLCWGARSATETRARFACCALLGCPLCMQRGLRIAARRSSSPNGCPLCTAAPTPSSFH